jgi:hypothetical protein
MLVHTTPMALSFTTEPFHSQSVAIVLQSTIESSRDGPIDLRRSSVATTLQPTADLGGWVVSKPRIEGLRRSLAAMDS